MISISINKYVNVERFSTTLSNYEARLGKVEIGRNKNKRRIGGIAL